MTKKERLIENLKNTIHLYCEDRKEGKDVKRIEDGLKAILDEFGYMFTSNRIVARLKMQQLEKVYKAETLEGKEEALKVFFNDFFVHFRQ